jgi:hypothetical protein
MLMQCNAIMELNTWGVTLIMGQWYIQDASEDVRFAVVDIWVVVSLLDWWRSSPGRDMVEEGRREMDKAEP